MALEPGSRLGSYEVLSSLGSGGMGEVYRARDTELGRDVAVKVLPEAFARDPDRLSRFKREARVLAALNHPSIASIYGIESSDSGQALILELVEGSTLAERLASGPVRLEEAVGIAEQIADALVAAHAKGIIHRDLKTANVKLAEGRVKVLDSGLAKHKPTGETQLAEAETQTETRLGLVVGTVPYMSPEQALGRDIDPRTDIFSLGVILYEMATGRRPFTGISPTEIIDQILHADPPPLAGPGAAELERVVRRCLAKSREERYSTAEELVADLRSVARAGDGPRPTPTQALPPTVQERPSPGDRAAAAPMPRRWWELDLVLAILFSPALIYLAWFAQRLVVGPWALSAFYAVVLSVLLAAILRGSLLTMAAFGARRLASEARRQTALVRVADLATSAALLALAIGLDVSSYVVTFSLLAWISTARY
jgi:serine/threonine protein kinase